ncbi:MAG TPA: hypothetical protein P5526_19565 [Anaerolineae bacterium]|nr:hypothetical protein [Anaerolineae bacterium]MCB0182406.1 hypothetical protein [Anaerolineae bacterium]MCB0226637.1 hypothetical protein [Anaerolineae bacterium]MCB9103004.1 hypothetical protein [Anaerolineales bacterium]HRV94364.1 hypothetical protein [Anaerolineae bacterium]
MVHSNTINKIPLIIVIVYLVLVFLSIIPIFIGDDALSGIFAVILTAPWSALLGNLLTSGSTVAGLLLIMIGAAINAAILYFVSRWIVGFLT